MAVVQLTVDSMIDVVVYQAARLLWLNCIVLLSVVILRSNILQFFYFLLYECCCFDCFQTNAGVTENIQSSEGN